MGCDVESTMKIVQLKRELRITKICIGLLLLQVIALAIYIYVR